MKKPIFEDGFDDFEMDDVKPTRKAHCKIYCEIDGVSQTFREWADQVGLPWARLYSRWKKGDRGADIIRPINTKASQPPDKSDIRRNITRHKHKVTKSRKSVRRNES